MKDCGYSTSPHIDLSVSDATYHTPLLHSPLRVVKRGGDIVMSLAMCAILLPLLPFLAIAIRWQSRGPIFFRQERTGLDGKTFTCYKLRTMHVNSECDTRQATEHDPRIFALGQFMRKTRIDELPQFYNVLKGDMSIIGPRPHMLYHTRKYSQLIPQYMARHLYRPGITGFAQVTGYCGETPQLSQMEERVRRDIWYIEHWSIGLDLWILYRTAASVIAPGHESNN